MAKIDAIEVEIINLKKINDCQEKKIQTLHDKIDELPDKILNKIQRSILLIATLAGTVTAIITISIP